MNSVWTGDPLPTTQVVSKARAPDGSMPGLYEDVFWLNSSGEPWTENGVRNFVREGVKIALEGAGRDCTRSAGGLATGLYHNGWEIDKVAFPWTNSRRKKAPRPGFEPGSEPRQGSMIGHYTTGAAPCGTAGDTSPGASLEGRSPI